MFSHKGLLSLCFALLTLTSVLGQDTRDEGPFPAERAKETNINVNAGSEEKNPKLSGTVERAVRSFHQRGNDWAANMDEGELAVKNGKILVEIRCNGKEADRISAMMKEYGVEIYNEVVPSLTEAWVPVSAVEELIKDAGVYFVAPARPVANNIGSVDSQEIAFANADLWHAAGIDGSGVTIGNVDSNYFGYITAQGNGNFPSGAQLNIQDLDGGGIQQGTNNHGTNTVEINYDMAPGANFVVYDIQTNGDWYQALTQASTDGVDIISASLGAFLNGVGDGSECPPGFAVPCGSIAEAAGIAKSQGVLVVNAAGNERDSHWGGLYNPSGTVPGTHDWGGGNLLQSNVCLPPGFQVITTLHWNDWNNVNHDYDLEVYRLTAGGWSLFAQSTSPQTGAPGQTPEEFLVFNSVGSSPNCPTTGGCAGGCSNYSFLIRRNSGATNHNLQLYAGIPVFNPVFARSLGFPADSPNVFTVSAVDVFSTIQESYSSEGPVLGPGGSLAASTIDKPDLVSVANVATWASGSFNGTSAATPHVAGLAALVKQLNPTLDVDGLADELRQIASLNDLGTAGFDFQHGHGLLRFTGGPPFVLQGNTFYDAAMTMPANTITVEAENLNTGQSFQADTLNNFYLFPLEPADVSAGDVLRIIAKDDTHYINVTDQTITAADLSNGTLTLDLVLDEYFLDVVDFPYYAADTPNPDQNAGPAVAQAVLNYIWWDSTANPTPPLTFPSQAALYTQGLAENETAGLSYLDTRGMWKVIQDNRPLPYSTYRYNFSIKQDTDGTELLKQIAQWVDYTIPTLPGHPIHVPGSIPAYGDYTNWMAVRGIHTNEAAHPLPATLQVYGFWINDPVAGGIGENSYKTAAEILSTYFFPLSTGDSYDGKYVAICEPPGVDKSRQAQLIDSPKRFDVNDKNLLNAVRAGNQVTQAQRDAANQKIIAAATAGAYDQLGPYDENFTNRLDSTSAGTPLLIERGSDDYYAVPFNDRAGTAVVILVGAEDGEFKEASWTPTGVSYPTVSSAKAVDAVQEAMRKHGIKGTVGKASLVYNGGSPYHPDWQIPAGSYTFTVGQDGSVTYQ